MGFSQIGREWSIPRKNPWDFGVSCYPEGAAPLPHGPGAGLWARRKRVEQPEFACATPRGRIAAMFTKYARYASHVTTVALVIGLCACPSVRSSETTSVGGTMYAPIVYEETYPVEVQTAIDLPTTFLLRVSCDDALYFGETPSSEDDVQAWLILTDPVGGHAAQVMEFHLEFVGSGWYHSTISRSVEEWIGPGHQLQPAEWSVRVVKHNPEVGIGVICDVTYYPYVWY
jgi:hypothetical protein